MSGTFSVLDSAHANWNGGSLFLYVDGHKQDPVSLSVDAPQSWTIVNGDVTQPGQRQFHFPNYDLLIDSPTEVAPAGSLSLDSFVVDNRKYRVMVHHHGPPPSGARERFVRDVERIVRYENSVFGPPPLAQYTFLFNIGFPGGDGFDGFDYTHEQYEPSLRVAEGWTEYYGRVALHRAGIEDTTAFYRRMAALIEQKPHDTFFSYYTKGAGLAAYLDLLLRNRSANAKSLDDAFNNTNMHAWFASHVGGTEDMDYDEALRWAGLRLVRVQNGPSRIEEAADATPAQLKVRLGWITGRRDR